MMCWNRAWAWAYARKSRRQEQGTCSEGTCVPCCGIWDSSQWAALRQPQLGKQSVTLKTTQAAIHKAQWREDEMEGSQTTVGMGRRGSRSCGRGNLEKAGRWQVSGTLIWHRCDWEGPCTNAWSRTWGQKCPLGDSETPALMVQWMIPLVKRGDTEWAGIVMREGS